MSAAALRVPQRARLAALADAIAPGTDAMPSATSVGLAEAGGLIDRVLALRPDLATRVMPILDAAMGEPSVPAFLERLGHETPNDLLALMEVVAGAYYLAPEVQRRIGYSGQQALSLGRGEIGAEDLLAEMMQRPPRWRRTGDHTGQIRSAAGAR